MTTTPDIQASQGTTVSAIRSIAADIRVPQGTVVGGINFPTPHMQTAQGLVQVGVGPHSRMQTSQGATLAAVRGRITNFRLRAWTFTLDGHDFYVLNLGDGGTVVYDVSTGQWMNWDSGDNQTFRANLGLNWSTRLSHDSNTDVIAGDDSTGMMYWLNPLQSYDEDALGYGSQNSFTRTLTGGIALRGRGSQPVNMVFLTGAPGTALSGTQVQLRTSDDFGHNWQDHGYVTVDPNSWSTEYTWYGLGSFSYPGRIFEVSDNGLARIDSLDMT